MKRSRKERKSPTLDTSHTDSDSCEDLKTKGVVIMKQEAPSQVSLCKLFILVLEKFIH